MSNTKITKMKNGEKKSLMLLIVSIAVPSLKLNKTKLKRQIRTINANKPEKAPFISALLNLILLPTENRM